MTFAPFEEEFHAHRPRCSRQEARFGHAQLHAARRHAVRARRGLRHRRSPVHLRARPEGAADLRGHPVVPGHAQPGRRHAGESRHGAARRAGDRGAGADSHRGHRDHHAQHQGRLRQGQGRGGRGRDRIGRREGQGALPRHVVHLRARRGRLRRRSRTERREERPARPGAGQVGRRTRRCRSRRSSIACRAT